MHIYIGLSLSIPVLSVSFVTVIEIFGGAVLKTFATLSAFLLSCKFSAASAVF